MSGSKKEFPDPRLRAVLRSFAESYKAKRAAAFAGLDFEALRDRLAAVKDAAVRDMPVLLDAFERRATARGARVLRAASGDDANALIRDILKEHKARTVVKSKSMVSEETRLNAALEEWGYRPRETDLGEWIVQLAGECPSHMVMPAIHMTRGDVAGIFERRLGREMSEDIPALVQTAREELRREIFEAGAGLTGANALIAESGATMLVTNEGNGRLCTSVPPVHIVLASIEKVVPTVEDALLLLRILTRSATGQIMTSYVSFLAGPPREHAYIILLDNNRSALRDDPVFRDVLRCIKCSACLNVCPVYLQAGGKEFAHIYMGGIGSLLTAWIHGLEASKKMTDMCLGCHRCDAVCSTKIPIAALVRALKERLVDETGQAFWKRLALDGVMGRPGISRAAFGLARAARPVVTKDGFARKLPPGLGRFDRGRALPAPARKPLSAIFKTSHGSTSTKGTVIIFPGCLIEQAYPEVGLAAARVLEKLGYDVRLGPVSCCGFPQANAGHTKEAAKTFRKALKNMPEEGTVVTLCPTCTTMLAEIGPAAAPSQKAEELAGRVMPFSRFLARFEAEALASIQSRGGDLKEKTATYHDSCHHKHVLGASGDSREIVERALGKPLVEMSEPDACCGFAGLFSASHPEISQALAADKLDAIRETGAGLVALDCPGCLLQIRGACRSAGADIDVRHTAEILDEVLG
jgi:iron-sulfur cluster protein